MIPPNLEAVLFHFQNERKKIILNIQHYVNNTSIHPEESINSLIQEIDKLQKTDGCIKSISTIINNIISSSDDIKNMITELENSTQKKEEDVNNTH